MSGLVLANGASLFESRRNTGVPTGRECLSFFRSFLFAEISLTESKADYELHT
jgi:hypothetical protein